ncbi:MAG: energy transducer TonB [Caldimonas sp.]
MIAAEIAGAEIEMVPALCRRIRERAVLSAVLLVLAGAQACAAETWSFVFPPTRQVTQFDPQVRSPGTVLLAAGAPRAKLVLLPQLPAVERGDAVLRIALDQDGVPRTVELVRSCGKRLLDRGAVVAVRGFRFEPPGSSGDVAEGFVRVHAGT